MKALGNDRGGITLTVIAPVVAAIIGGTVAVLTAVQIVNLAPDEAGPATTQLSGDVQYGER